ncbi:HD domain-containing phosphohydrolase [[Clostridium] dakarense]|uniref:HD domain-containing phosphohydrolase n=1 Tax=Faecalimicrobium dakarense TaxID=1301100 RepID=UPI00241825A2|nr:HD domain-containing phosphohydrolase [[Clostridium] dakarense]
MVNHGEETAYIAYKIAKELGYSNDKIDQIIRISILHDIGAYKTEEIKNLKKFEVSNTGRHSIYGYIILNSSKLFKDMSEAVLYHHHSYKDKDKFIKGLEIPQEAFLIGLADRVSIFCSLLNYNEKRIIDNLQRLNKSLFEPSHTDALFKLIEKEGLINDIVDSTYKLELNKRLESIKINLDKAKEYLVFLPLSIDFFSFETSIHTVSVSTIAKKICEKMSLNEQYKNKIEIGAYLHDLGKVCIPKYILEKDGKLTENEFEIMKQHAVYSRDILEEAGISKELIDLACNHHERLDGSGYPRGLKGEELSIGDRVISISDIFCALTEKRIYKNPFSKDEALGILHSMSNSNYIDKNLVKIVDNNYEEFLECIIENRNSYKKILNDMVKTYNYIANEMDLLCI